MSFQDYVNKVQSWIEQGRLSLPRGAEVHVFQKDEEGFYIEIEYTGKDKPPMAKAGDISV